MPTGVAPPSSNTVRQGPRTRSSIRQSFGLTSMGRVLADVMHKDNKEAKDTDKDKEKSGKKAKETASRRSSLLPPPRPSLDIPAGSRGDKVTSPEVKTITRHTRRGSAIQKPPLSSSDERSSSPSSVINPKPPVTRASTLRAKTAATTTSTSTLPKYRPRSFLGEQTAPKKPPSPVRNGMRRYPSTSDDEGDDEPKGKGALQLDMGNVPQAKSGKVSPHPHLGALKVNLTGAINVRPSTPEKKTKPSTPTSQSTPTRSGRVSPSKLPKGTPSKLSKVSTTAPSSRTQHSRAPSVASSSSSAHSPHTPKTPSSIKGIFGSGQKNGSSGSPLRKNIPSPPESPLGRLSARKRAGKLSPIPSPAEPARNAPAPTIFTEGSSIDSMDADDVEFMLSTIASPSAPTPAIPRFRKTNSQDSYDSYDPQTPSRPGFLPTRANLSYISPAPPSSDTSPFLRPNPRRPGNDRGSILSWEQLALQSKVLGPEDIGSMLSDIPAPFRSAAASPAPSTLPDIPESPSTLPSPTSYGSISQVLLPDVTPSPAIHNLTLRFEQMAPEDPVDHSTMMQLRLQIASIENTNQLQYERIQSLESQLQAAKRARLQDATELARQISELEEQVHGNLKAEEQRTDHIALLEDQLARSRIETERALAEASKKAAAKAAVSRNAALKGLDAKWCLAAAASEASARWRGVGDSAEGELEMIRASREMLGVLLAGLDQSQRQVKYCA